MKCYRSLQRYYNLENERKELDKSLKAGIVKVGEWVKLQPVRAPTRTEKCSKENTPQVSPPRGIEDPILQQEM